MNTPDEWTPDEQRLRDALHRAAEQMNPAPDGLARIRDRIANRPGWRSPVTLGLAAAAAVAAAVIVGGAMFLDGGDDDPIATSTSPSAEPEPTATADTDKPTDPASGSPDPTPSGGPGEAITVPVYYVTDTSVGARLAREFHTMEATTPPVEAAVRRMFAEPAADLGYESAWQPGVEVMSVDVGDDAIAVDLAGSPELAGSPDSAELAVQQLVYTATAAASMHDEDGTLPVRLTVDGEPATDLFGELDVSQPVGRDDPLAVRQLVQINNPAENTAVTSPVTVSGEAAAFEATLNWQIRHDGAVVDSDVVTAEECCVFSPFEFTVDLDPGVYKLVVSEVDVSDGEGRLPMSDTKTFTVN